jgi:hypothetical protein
MEDTGSGKEEIRKKNHFTIKLVLSYSRAFLYFSNSSFNCALDTM